MGFFSADCTGCGHPLLSAYATTEVNAWMQRGVTVFEDGSIVKGLYDGYGHYQRTGSHSQGLGFESFEDVVYGTVWHEACWKVAGSPTDFRGISKDSADQGYFFEDGAHDMVEPVPGAEACQHPNCEKHGKSPCEGVDCTGHSIYDDEENDRG